MWTADAPRPMVNRRPVRRRRWLNLAREQKPPAKADHSPPPIYQKQEHLFLVGRTSFWAFSDLFGGRTARHAGRQNGAVARIRNAFLRDALSHRSLIVGRRRDGNYEGKNVCREVRARADFDKEVDKVLTCVKTATASWWSGAFLCAKLPLLFS